MTPRETPTESRPAYVRPAIVHLGAVRGHGDCVTGSSVVANCTGGLAASNICNSGTAAGGNGCFNGPSATGAFCTSGSGN